ncbi:MAG: VTT domain-containing protein [Parcubacteria group bacterium]|nr:VTT domain-containing protein [Parcubacteria group bacterium]
MFGLDLISLVKTAGYFGLFAIVFAETGLFFGFFFPGDSLLFTAGFLASQGIMNLPLLIAIFFLAAILGNSAGYVFGRKMSEKLFERENSIIFSRNHVEQTKKFYEKHGAKAMILARFVPIVRTFAPIMAGVGKMAYSKFLFYNVIGAILWAIGLTIFGYFLGSVVPNADRYIIPIVIAIIVISLLPNAVHLIRNPEHARRLWQAVKNKLSGK